MRAVWDAHKLCERPGEGARRSIVPVFHGSVFWFPTSLPVRTPPGYSAYSPSRSAQAGLSTSARDTAPAAVAPPFPDSEKPRTAASWARHRRTPGCRAPSAAAHRSAPDSLDSTPSSSSSPGLAPTPDRSFSYRSLWSPKPEMRNAGRHQNAVPTLASGYALRESSRPPRESPSPARRSCVPTQPASARLRSTPSPADPASAPAAPCTIFRPPSVAPDTSPAAPSVHDYGIPLRALPAAVSAPASANPRQNG